MIISGDWRLTLDTPMGVQVLTLILAEESGSLSGELQGHLGDARFNDGMIDGNRLQWEMITKPMGHEITIVCNATIEGKSISGSMEAPANMGTYEFTGEFIEKDNIEAKKRIPAYQLLEKRLKSELQILERHQEALAKAQAYIGGPMIKINAGCGHHLKEGWVNIDMSTEADLQLDLREAMPFLDESVEIIYSEHFLEHLDFPDDACNFLSESFRVLKKGGEFSVGVPDTEWPLKAYVNKEPEYFLLAKERFLNPKWCNTPLHTINYHFRQCGDHKYAYDFETLAQVLKEAGFIDIALRNFDPQLDDEFRKIGTLYVQAFKPIV